MTASSVSSSTESSTHEQLSVIQPLSYSTSSCGYCSSSTPTGKSYGCWAHTLSSTAYKDLLDLGWRRSGKYLYKPDVKRTCCPSFSIKLIVDEFKMSKSCRQVLSRFNRFVQEGAQGDGEAHLDLKGRGVKEKQDSLLTAAKAVTFVPPTLPPIDSDDDFRAYTSTLPSVPPVPAPKPQPLDTSKSKSKGKGKNSAPADLLEFLREAELDDGSLRNKFEYIVEKSSFTQEKYELFKKYQTQIHGEPLSKVTPKGFRRFLVDSPLEMEATSSPSYSYGSFHAKYILSGVLIAFAVIDILPKCLSSVYFVWDPQYAHLGLGKIGALREIGMCKEWPGGGMEYYMGYYIHSCQKMRYKSAYQPSLLLDPETNVFYPWKHCLPLLEKNDHASFSRPESSGSSSPSSPSTPIAAPSSPFSPSPSGTSTYEDDEEEEEENEKWPIPPPLGCLNPTTLPKELLVETSLLEGNTLVPLLFSSAWGRRKSRKEILECLAALGLKMKGRVVMWVNED